MPLIGSSEPRLMNVGLAVCVSLTSGLGRLVRRDPLVTEPGLAKRAEDVGGASIVAHPHTSAARAKDGAAQRRLVDLIGLGLADQGLDRIMREAEPRWT